MEIPAELRYSREHEWARLDGDNVTVGITDFAQDALGDVVYVQLPEIGTSVGRGDSLGEVESTKSVSDLFAPVAGTITAVNTRLADAPNLLNDEPYGEGWLCTIALADGESVDHLLSAGEYGEFTN